VSDLTIARPMANLEAVLPIGSRLLQLATGRGHSRLSSQAVGLLETRGFPAMVGAADAMLKSADVVLAAYEMIGSGLCTVIIRGSVSNVGIALDVGMLEAERIGELHSVMLVPRPLDDLDQTLPLASCWIEESKPLQLPLSIKDKAEEPLALPLQQPRQEQRVMANEPLQLEGRPEFRPEFLREPRREYEEPPVVPGPAYVPTETAPLVSTDAAPHVSIEVAPTPIPDPSLEAPSPSGAPAPSPQPPLEKRPGKSKRKTPVRRPLDISEL
jgi:carbon dioxide concentrating mechanism protein CcmO